MTSQAAQCAAERTGVSQVFQLPAGTGGLSWSLVQLSAKKTGQTLRLSANTTTHPTRHNK